MTLQLIYEDILAGGLWKPEYGSIN